MCFFAFLLFCIILFQLKEIQLRYALKIAEQYLLIKKISYVNSSKIVIIFCKTIETKNEKEDNFF